MTLGEESVATNLPSQHNSEQKNPHTLVLIPTGNCGCYPSSRKLLFVAEITTENHTDPNAEC